ncbi:MAG: dienelactone hydrolase family protein [Pseudomonadota bacterium]|nr:dienelactone hydrolase family protein [Pseudomonadota bacterium]
MYKPNDDGPHPGIVLAQHIPVGHTGIENDEFTIKTAERYAANGYAVAVPFIFHWWPKSDDIQIKRNEFRDDWTKLDLEAAFDHLCLEDSVDGSRIGIVGHCWGGRVAWLGACHLSNLKACAIFYGGRVQLQMGPDTPPAIDLAANIKCPVAGYFGNDDQNPSPENVDDYEAALKNEGIDYEFHRYNGAGHAFQSFNSKDNYRENVSEDAWGKVLDFLGRNLTA